MSTHRVSSGQSSAARPKITAAIPSRATPTTYGWLPRSTSVAVARHQAWFFLSSETFSARIVRPGSMGRITQRENHPGDFQNRTATLHSNGENLFRDNTHGSMTLTKMSYIGDMVWRKWVRNTRWS